MNNERNETSWKNNFHASTSKNPQIICYYCEKVNHMKIDCRKRMNDLKATSFQENQRKLNKKNFRKIAYFQRMEQENLEKKKKLTQTRKVKPRQIWVKKDELKCLVIHTVLKAANTSQWYLDSECSRHMTTDKSLFSHYIPRREGSVTFGDRNTTKILGRGIVEVPEVLTLRDVLFIDGFKHNLLSISQICDLGYEVGFIKK